MWTWDQLLCSSHRGGYIRHLIAMLITPINITELKANEIFVFGSNKDGRHIGGAARIAHDSFGAEWGVGIGITGSCYAIPTMFAHAKDIEPFIKDFIRYAR